MNNIQKAIIVQKLIRHYEWDIEEIRKTIRKDKINWRELGELTNKVFRPDWNWCRPYQRQFKSFGNKGVEEYLKLLR